MGASAEELVPGCHSVTYIEPRELAELLNDSASRQKVLVIDVRDEDEDSLGGRIVGAVSAPSERFEPELQRSQVSLADYGDVVVHCAHSRQRGPRCARILERLYFDPTKRGPSPSFRIRVLRGGYCDFSLAFPDLVR